MPLQQPSMDDDDPPPDGRPVDGGDIWAAYHRAHNMGPLSWHMLIAAVAIGVVDGGALLLAHYLGTNTFMLWLIGLILTAMLGVLIGIAVALYRESRR